MSESGSRAQSEALTALEAQKELMSVMEGCLKQLEVERIENAAERLNLQKENRSLDKQLNEARQLLEDRTSELKAAHRVIALLKQKLESHKVANAEWQRQNSLLQQQLAAQAVLPVPHPSQGSEVVQDIPTSQTEIFPLSQPLLQQSIGLHSDPVPYSQEAELASSQDPSEKSEQVPQQAVPQDKLGLDLKGLLARDWHPQDFVRNEAFDPNTVDMPKAKRLRVAIESLAETRAREHDTPPGFWTSALKFAENTQAERAEMATIRKEDALSRLVEALTPGGRYLFRDQSLRINSSI